MPWLLMFCQIAKSIEDIKRSIEERDSAVKKAEDGAADLKMRFGELSKNLEEYEKEYQVSFFLYILVFTNRFYKCTCLNALQASSSK